MPRKFANVVLVTFLFVVVLSSTTPTRAEENRRDGNWWRSQPEFVRPAYTLGFFDGMLLGNKFSYWKYANQPIVRKIVDSYVEYQDKYMLHVTNTQLVDGLNSFYDDYRNRSIIVADAVWLVLNSIAGTPEGDLEKMIESWRKSAVQK